MLRQRIMEEWEGLLFREGSPRTPLVPPGEDNFWRDHEGRRHRYDNADEESYREWRTVNPDGHNYKI